MRETTEMCRTGRTPRSRGIALAAALATPVLAVSIGAAIACGGSGGGAQGFGNSGDSTDGGANGNGNGGGSGSGSGPSGQPSPSSSARFVGSGDAASCDPSVLDQVGCVCQAGAPPRTCYSGPPATRGLGACHDGKQSCGGGEVGVWGPCQGEVVPDPCATGNCEGPSYCTPPRDAAPPIDAAPDAGLPPNCHYIMGGISGFFDGGYYCEGNVLGSLGGLLGGAGH